MGEAAAEGSPHADRVVADMADHGGEQRAERSVLDRPVEGAMPGERADRQRVGIDGDLFEVGNPVDVDQVGRAGEAERHSRHQALTAGENPRVLG